MPKLMPDDLDKIAERMKRSMSLREGAGRAKITVHIGTCGIAAGARKIMSAVMRCIEESGAHDIIVVASGCAGLCSHEPMMTVELVDAAPVKYVNLTEQKVKQIFDAHIAAGKVVVDCALAVGSEQRL